MAEGTEDDRGGAGGAAPDPGTTDASDAAATAQGAEGAGGAAPDAGTTDADVLEISRSADPEGEGADEASEAKRLRDKLAFTQGRSDAFGRMSKQVQELHPDYFDAEGNFVGKPEESADEDVLTIGRAADPSSAAAPQRAASPAAGGPRGFSVDPNEAYRKDFNEKALSAIFGEDGDPDFVGPTVGVVDARLAQLGITPQVLARLAAGGAGGGLTRDQVAEMVDQRSRNVVKQYDEETTAFKNRADAIGEMFGAGFLAHKIKFPDRPEMTIREALPIICAHTGSRDPYAAVLAHEKVGALAIEALTNAKAVVLARAMVAEGGGEQIMADGGGFPGGGVVPTTSIAGSFKPLKR